MSWSRATATVVPCKVGAQQPCSARPFYLLPVQSASNTPIEKNDSRSVSSSVTGKETGRLGPQVRKSAECVAGRSHDFDIAKFQRTWAGGARERLSNFVAGGGPYPEEYDRVCAREFPTAAAC